MRRRHLVAAGITLGAALLAVGALGAVRSNPADDDPAPEVVAADAPSVAFTGRVAGSSIEEMIDGLTARVEQVPGDYASWATLGLAYVQQARVTADTSLYLDAESALAQSAAVGPDDNFLALTGRAALAAARHDFPEAERLALAGLELNDSNPTLYGVLSDAQIQLGKYDEGFASVQRMVDLAPGTASFARVSYTHELAGDAERAEEVMRRALDTAATASDRAFALFQLGEMELGSGDPNAALTLFNAALRESPDDVSALSGRAHSLFVSGQIETSLDAYERLIDVAPTADFLIEYGDVLDGLGRTTDAEALYARAREQLDVDASYGALPDPGIIIFEADRGDAARALRDAQAAVARQPFFETHEAHAWALHRNGRNAEALDAMARAMEWGASDAELHLRAAAIHEALGDEPAAARALATALAIDPFLPVPADLTT